ncbi:MAG: hypothetical protein DMG56_19690 [Acidobacteria bacterium]|nr:MAG: hypothetical protein DMG53_02715 [Acidobacteriota bacterium]PYU58924.1 MAG: hypothetical protein DMG56_19690 [Acidobacteriota bacterium]PYU62651.1 MAG: hypothetical protein DMG55_03065 [Acidobacteriota bacterium]PYU73040.1 MAG: hypothetical protein DMG52_16710 [Acidobacteriota bacterium]
MRKYDRFVEGFRRFAEQRMTPDEALAKANDSIRKRVLAREENFLSFVEKGIFQYACSPYLKLLERKRIQFNDLKTWVGKDGIERALRTLENEGVYFTVDEFKGKVPVVRNGIEFWCQEGMFDNPFLSYVYEVRSGATRSAGTRVRIDFDYLHQRSLYDALFLNMHGCLKAPIANWFPIFPGAPGINSSLRFADIGNPVQRWFSQVPEDQLNVNWEKKWGTKLIFTLGKLHGCRLAEPEYVGLEDALKVAEWAAAALQQHENCVVYTFASSAVRVCIAAAEKNLNIKGTKFLVTGEPLTPQKRTEIEAVGGAPVPVYGISEAGVIAAGCDQNHPQSDHCHLYKDTTAIISHRQNVPHSDLFVESYLFTSLLYESPKILLNVGMGDYGEISSESCACVFGQVGFDACLNNIRSYEKLTGEGVTFVDTDFIRIVERDLPERFGGRSTDYQLVEKEDSRGFTHLQLLVSPRVGEIQETEVLDRFLNLLRRAEASPDSWSQSGTEMWKQSNMLQIVREFPVPTVSGKIMPFFVSKPKSVPSEERSTASQKI